MLCFVLSNILEHFGSSSENTTLGVLVNTLIRKQLKLKQFKPLEKCIMLMVSTFPVSQKILKIFARLLICVSTAKRSPPPLTVCLKTWLRSTNVQKR